MRTILHLGSGVFFRAMGMASFMGDGRSWLAQPFDRVNPGGLLSFGIGYTVWASVERAAATWTSSFLNPFHHSLIQYCSFQPNTFFFFSLTQAMASAIFYKILKAIKAREPELLEFDNLEPEDSALVLASLIDDKNCLERYHFR